MEAMHVLNGVVALMCAIALSLIVLNPNIHEGVVIKFGLMLMIFGLGTTAALTLYDLDSSSGFRNAGMTTRIGLLVAIIGLRIKWQSLFDSQKFSRSRDKQYRTHNSQQP